MRSIFPAAVILLAAACGDDGSPGTPDAPDTIDAPVTIDAPPLPGECDYSEMFDGTNDDIAADGTPETTGKTLATSVTICGQIDSGHFIAADDIVDIDGYAVTLPAGKFKVTVSGAGLETLSEVILGVYNGANFGDIVAETPFHGTHVFYMNAFAEAGAVEFAVISLNATAITAPIPYKIVITTDDPSQRCPTITAPADHVEGPDTGNTSNNVVDVNYSATPPTPVETLSLAANDVPEVATGGTIGATTNYRITGELAETAAVGSYKDRDTFSFMTGPTTDQISVRVNWPGAQDVDILLFEAALPSIGVGRSGEAQQEFKTFAVKPSTTYWLWTGLYLNGTGPVPYSISLCGADFTPP